MSSKITGRKRSLSLTLQSHRGAVVPLTATCSRDVLHVVQNELDKADIADKPISIKEAIRRALQRYPPGQLAYRQITEESVARKYREHRGDVLAGMHIADKRLGASSSQLASAVAIVGGTQAKWCGHAR